VRWCLSTRKERFAGWCQAGQHQYAPANGVSDFLKNFCGAISFVFLLSPRSACLVRLCCGISGKLVLFFRRLARFYAQRAR
jgi:hypothetical protein